MILKYPVRAALNPFASTIGYLLPFMVSGSVIISLVLSLPTVGPLLLHSLMAQDMFLARTIVLLLGVLTVIGTLLSDLLLMWIDPRIRLGAVPMSEAVIAEPLRHRGGDPRRGRHPAPADVVALPQAQARGDQRGDRRRCSTWSRCSPTSSPTRRRSTPRPRRSYIPPQPIHWFDADGSFQPHVYALKGKRDPRTFKLIYAPDASEPRDLVLFAHGYPYKLPRPDPDRHPPVRRRRRQAGESHCSCSAPTSSGATCSPA